MKKISILILSVMIVMLAACGTAQNSSSQSSEPEATEAAKTEEEQEATAHDSELMAETLRRLYQQDAVTGDEETIVDPTPEEQPKAQKQPEASAPLSAQDASHRRRNK